jgi:hypothetical protein
MPNDIPMPLTPEKLLGTWVTDVHQTDLGPMAFEFHLASDGQLQIDGIAADPANVESYHRSGPYRLDYGRLISPVINLGQPASIAVHDGRLTLTVDDTLTLHLRRK